MQNACKCYEENVSVTFLMLSKLQQCCQQIHTTISNPKPNSNSYQTCYVCNNKNEKGLHENDMWQLRKHFSNKKNFRQDSFKLQRAKILASAPFMANAFNHLKPLQSQILIRLSMHTKTERERFLGQLHASYGKSKLSAEKSGLMQLS